MAIRFLAGSPQCVVFDFDETAARTFADAAPAIVGVEEASRRAAVAVFGEEGGEALIRSGGAQNRSPREVVKALFESGDYVMFSASAQGYMYKHYSALQACVPSGKGRALRLASRGSMLELATELFVRAKLLVLLSQVSVAWPVPSPGFFGCLELLRKVGIKTGIVSAGHELFITKFFSVHGVEPPPMVTDDDIRGGVMEGITKPDPRLLQFFLERESGGVPVSCENVLYVGDDVERDGYMARDAGSMFWLYNPSGIAHGVKLWDGAFEFECFDRFASAVMEERLVMGL